ncbi:MAG: zinc-dependent metalloprotease family protein, partial [Planctomycetota bacterium]
MGILMAADWRAAAIVTAVGRANVAYEADLAIHFNLVANNDQIVFFNPDTDPYDATCGGGGGADCSGNLLNPNMSLLYNVIGTENYDVGQVLSRIFGGVAYLSVVCDEYYKGGGVSGMPRGGDVESLAFLVMIHELGHQFGANHTFNGTRGRCQGNVHLSTAWEAGSGSSPMAYAGGCPVGNAEPTDNVVQFADPYFHHGSVGEMESYLTTISCPALTPTANNIPTILSYPASVAIPAGTPFALAVSANDLDGDPLAYSWEEYDSGFARPLTGTGSEDNGIGALFRVFPPVASPERSFPRMADVLSGVPTPGEMLPTTGGVTRRFRVMVRDNHPGAGGVVISPFVTLSIVSGGAPFAITAPVQNELVRAGNYAVTWAVGGTSAAPISCSSVTIRLSTDDGATFAQSLGSFPNTGSAVVSLPSSTATARVKVEGNANIFFAVSRPFLLRPLCPPDFDNDGTVDFFDYDAFVNCFEGLACPPGMTADFDGDATVDFFDYDAFVIAFEVGC